MLRKKLIISIVVLIVGSIFLLIFFVFMNKKKEITPPSIIPTPTPYKQIIDQFTFKSIAPAISSKDDVFRNLGAAVKTTKNNNLEILSYPTKSEYLFIDIFITDENKVKYIVQSTTTENEVGTYTDFIKKFPKGEEGIVYEEGDSIREWKVFSTHGVAVFTNSVGYISKVLYFSPVTFAEFLDIVAKDFSLSPTRKPQF